MSFHATRTFEIPAMWKEIQRWNLKKAHERYAFSLAGSEQQTENRKEGNVPPPPPLLPLLASSEGNRSIGYSGKEYVPPPTKAVSLPLLGPGGTIWQEYARQVKTLNRKRPFDGECQPSKKLSPVPEETVPICMIPQSEEKKAIVPSSMELCILCRPSDEIPDPSTESS